MLISRSRAALLERLPWLLNLPEQSVRNLALALVALSAVLGVFGGTWDAAWHVTLKRETFWTPPHLLLYSGTAIALFGSLLGLAVPWLRSRALWIVEPGFAIAAIGASVVIGAAPLDDFWHRTFGRDVDVWSFPHLVAIGGGVGINLGAALATRKPGSPAWAGAARVLFLVAFLWVCMFGLNWYTLVLARVRDSLEYPLLAVMVSVPPLILAHFLVGRVGAALVAALCMAYVFTAHGFLALVGYAQLPFPPVVLLGAVAIDLIATRPSVPRGVIAGLAYVPLFFLGEAISLAFYPHPALPPPRSEAALSYISAVAERPWDLEHVAMALPLVLIVGALAGGVAMLVAKRLRPLEAS